MAFSWTVTRKTVVEYVKRNWHPNVLRASFRTWAASWFTWVRAEYLTLSRLRRLGSILLKLAPWVIIAVFSYWYIWMGWLNELRLRNGLDLGTYHQILYNVDRGEIPPWNTLKGSFAWGDHAHFIMALFAPLYRLLPGPMTVIGIQALAITTSAYALYAVAQDRLRNYIFSFTLLFAYLLFFGVQYALDFDFHANVLTAAILAWSYYSFHFKKWGWYWVTVGLGLLTREDAATFYVAFSMYTFFAYFRTRKLVSVMTALVATCYFFFIGYVVMPRWSPGGIPLQYFDIPDQARTPWEIFSWIAGNPKTIWGNMWEGSIRKRTMESLFATFGYLPLASPFTYISVLPNFLARFLSGETQRHMMKFHYSASLVSVLSFGAILGTDLLVRVTRIFVKKRRKLVQFVITTLAAASLAWGTYTISYRDTDLPLHKLSNENYAPVKQHPRQLYPTAQLVKGLVPINGQVSAASGLVPLFSDRKEIYNYPAPFDRDAKTDWVVLSSAGNTWPLPAGAMKSAIKDFHADPEYKEVFEGHGIVLFRRLREQERIDAGLQ